MHKLYEYACDELKELEKKAEKCGLTASELEYADKLTELKKNILKIHMLEDDGYSSDYRDGTYYYRGNSYAGRRNARRDSMGRYSREGYSRAAGDMVDQLRDMMESAPDEQTRNEIHRMVDRLSKA